MSGDDPSLPAAGGLIPRLIVGLGNPGRDYRDTRHNVGFMVVDQLSSRFGVSFSEEKRWHGMVAKFPGGWLLKPQTFMNDSGRCVQAVAQFYKVSPAETVVVHDDVDLPLGRIRLRLAGSAAGHNGLRSLIQTLGTDAFPRLKIGIASATGRPAGERLVNHVLGRFEEQERPGLEATLDRAAEAVTMALKSGFEAAMNLFNRKEEP